MKKVLLTVSVTVLLMLAAAYPAPADLSLDVAPAKYEVQVSPGTLQTFPITVRNTGDTSLHVQASLSDFAVAPGGGYIFSKPGHNRYSLAKWASINPREFDVAPNSFQQVRFTLSVPQGISGEYSGIVFFQTRPQRHAGSGLAFSERIASKVYAYTANSLHVDGAIDSMTEKPIGGGEKFSVGFKNTGNAHLYLNGRIDIHRGSQVVATVPLPQEELVERGGRRLFVLDAAKLSPGSYSATALIDYGGPSLAGGQMTFTVR
jgi:hypothetical protein